MFSCNTVIVLKKRLVVNKQYSRKKLVAGLIVTISVVEPEPAGAGLFS